MERNKLGRIHNWIVRILIGIVFALVVVTIWLTFVSCEDGKPIMTKQCKCRVIGDTIEVVRNKKDYDMNITNPCGHMNQNVEKELGVKSVSCESYSEK